MDLVHVFILSQKRAQMSVRDNSSSVRNIASTDLDRSLVSYSVVEVLLYL